MKKKRSLSMRAFFTLFIILQLLLVDLCASLLYGLLRRWIPAITQVPKVVWILVISIILATVITAVLMKVFLNPVTRLSKAMGKVAGGELDIQLGTDRNFPEIRQINEDFNFMTRQLASTERLQAEFISNVSHEFKTPINAIEGYATLLQGGQEEISPEQARYVEKILINTRRLTHLVGNILLLSKVDSQTLPQVSTYRLDEQIRQAIVALEPRWMERETEFDVDLERAEYRGNETMLQHVWANLIENAVKYGPRGGLISMKLTAREGEDIVFTIADEGPGIPEEEQPHVFDRFYQCDNSRKTEGNGLGLALVRRIVEAAGGQISLRNRPEGGCVFTVTLPRPAPETP